MHYLLRHTSSSLLYISVFIVNYLLHGCIAFFMVHYFVHHILHRNTLTPTKKHFLQLYFINHTLLSTPASPHHPSSAHSSSSCVLSNWHKRPWLSIDLPVFWINSVEDIPPCHRLKPPNTNLYRWPFHRPMFSIVFLLNTRQKSDIYFFLIVAYRGWQAGISARPKSAALKWHN